MPLKTPRKTQLNILQADSLKAIPWLVHGFSTRPGGFSKVYGGRTLNLGFTQQDARAAVEKNREKFLRQLGATSKGRAWPLVMLRQIHSDLIHCVSALPKDIPQNQHLPATA